MTKEKDHLFDLRKDNLETGLRGVPVGYCITSRIDPEQGLYYRGKSIRELSHLSAEKVMYYLLEGSFDFSSPKYHIFCEKLHKEACIHDIIRQSISMLPRECYPMKLLMAALSIMANVEGKGDYRKDCISIIAKLPELIALVLNHHAGWGETPRPNPKLGYIENFCAMLQAPNVSGSEMFIEVFRLFHILHYDHGGGNLSTFVGKAIASGREEMYGSLVGSMAALDGPLHGGASQKCLAFLKEVHYKLGDCCSGDHIEDFVRKRLAAKELLFGFGHAVLRKEDSRSTVLCDAAERYFAQHPLIRIGFLLRERGSKVLKENPKVRDPYTNVDFLSGAVLCAAGFDYPEYLPVLFGMSRMVGISRQIVYERCEALHGKGLPIMRPKYLYRSQI